MRRRDLHDAFTAVVAADVAAVDPNRRRLVGRIGKQHIRMPDIGLLGALQRRQMKLDGVIRVPIAPADVGKDLQKVVRLRKRGLDRKAVPAHTQLHGRFLSIQA